MTTEQEVNKLLQSVSAHLKGKRFTPEQKKERAAQRKADREKAKKAAKIEAERTQKPVREIVFTIEWNRSRTWGMNPALNCEVRFKDGTFERSTTFRASGCGYDKESTVIAEAFNTYLKYKLYGKVKKSKRYKGDPQPAALPYGINIRPDWKYFAGGIGTNCYPAIAKAIGGKFETVSNGKTFSVFKYTDGE